MAAETSNVNGDHHHHHHHHHQAPSSDEFEEVKGWLIEMMKEKDPESRPKPRIQKVSPTLRGINDNDNRFNPLVVSLGPFHWNEESLFPMNRYKRVSARWFISLVTGAAGNDNKISVDAVADHHMEAAENVYKKYVKEVTTTDSSPTSCYDEHQLGFSFQFDRFMYNMFLDGCFILHFIHLLKEPKTSHLHPDFIVRDMFLLENQIPYTMLKALMSLIPPQSNNINIEEFLDKVVLPLHEPPHYSWRDNMTGFFKKTSSTTIGKDRAGGGGSNYHPADDDQKGDDGGGDPLHLLDFLRSKLIGKANIMIVDKQQHHPADVGSSTFSELADWRQYVRPVMQLKSSGIEVSRSRHKHLRALEFKQGLIYGHLKIPQIIVDGTTRTSMLNLIAYEMCPDSHLDRTVISYVCFLESLIHNADDVKELRSKNILLNRLGSDEAVASFFSGLAYRLTPDCNTYPHVLRGLRLHKERRFNHIRLWIGQLIRKHFNNPWTLMALNAAVIILLLALVQTIYSVLGYYHKK